MNNHKTTFIPLESWCYQSPELRHSGRLIDLGLFAEGLIYYDKVILQITSQPQLAEFILWFQRQKEYKTLLRLFENGTIQLYDYSFLTTPVLKDGVYSLVNIVDPSQQRPNSFEQRFLYHESLNGCFKNSTEKKNLYKVLRDKVIEVKVDEFKGVIDNAKNDLLNSDVNGSAVQYFVNTVAPLLPTTPPKDIKATITIAQDRITSSYNFNFDELAFQLGEKLNFNRGTPLQGFLQCNRFIKSAMDLQCDLFLGNPMGQLVGDKLALANQTGTKISKVITNLENNVEFPDIRKLTNENNLDLKKILEIRSHGKKFRNWLQSEGERDRNELFAYHTEVAKESGLITATRKALKIFGYLSTLIEIPIGYQIGGEIGTFAGAFTAAGTSFVMDYLSNLNSGWKPLVFGEWLEKEILIEDKSNGRNK